MDRNMPAPTEAVPTPSYYGLRDRAVRALQAAPDGLPDDELAQVVFGAGTGKQWQMILAGVLTADDRVENRAGRWRLLGRSSTRAPRQAPAGTTPPILTSGELQAGSAAIVTLALATTGADPRRHRIVRLAVVRREDNEITGRIDVVLDTGQRLSGYLRNAARLADDDLADAEQFGTIVPMLRELLDDHDVYAYGSQRVQAFLAAELRRADLPSLEARFIELDSLLRGLLPEAQKHGLYAAARELGIPHQGRSTPQADAELAALVVERLRERQRTSPGRDSLLGWPHSGGPPEPATMPFTQQWLAHMPDTPGVYVLEDAEGQTLYVGKAVSLRRRLADYVARQPSLHRRLEALSVRATAVSVLECPSDLEATLLEARLVKQRQPAFNVARATRAPTTLIRAAPDDRSPGVRLVCGIGSDSARYFGPFESASLARKALAVCRAAHPEAFARKLTDAARQREAVLQVCQLLVGQKEPTLAVLRLRMREAADAGDRPEIDRLRSAMRGVQTLDVQASPLAGLAAGWRLLVVERVNEWDARVHLLRDGYLIGSMDADMDISVSSHDAATAPDLARDIEASVTAPESSVGGSEDTTDLERADEPTLVLRWLAQSRSRIEVIRLPEPTSQ